MPDTVSVFLITMDVVCIANSYIQVLVRSSIYRPDSGRNIPVYRQYFFPEISILIRASTQFDSSSWTLRTRVMEPELPKAAFCQYSGKSNFPESDALFPTSPISSISFCVSCRETAGLMLFNKGDASVPISRNGSLRMPVTMPPIAPSLASCLAPWALLTVS